MSDIEKVVVTTKYVKEPFYKSVKKTLGVIGFVMYWLLQIPAVMEDPSVITELTMENAILVSTLLGIKTVGAIASASKKAE